MSGHPVEVWRKRERGREGGREGGRERDSRDDEQKRRVQWNLC